MNIIIIILSVLYLSMVLGVVTRTFELSENNSFLEIILFALVCSIALPGAIFIILGRMIAEKVMNGK